MRFRAFHGCLESERREGNDFEVDVTLEADIARAAASDRLEDTLDYGRVYSIVSREMAVPSDLLEHVAGRILEAIEAEFPSLKGASVRVSKKNPPVGGECGWSRVTVRK